MPIKVTCASCGKTLSAPDSAAGKKAKCPACSQAIVVPAAVHEAEAIGTAAAGPSGGLPAQAYAAPPPPATEGEIRQPCPECGEMIIKGAAKCRFCDAIFDPKLKLLPGARAGAASGELRQIATYQRGVILCVLFQVLAYMAVVALSGPAKANPALAVASLIWLCTIIAGVVFAVLVGIRVYSTAVGIILGVLTIIPCVGLVILLFINQAATAKLTANGIKVGFFGASTSQF